MAIGANASTSVTFAPFTLARNTVRGVVRAGTDRLPADNAFHFVLAPSRPVSILLVDQGDRAGNSFYLTRALAIGTAPAFQVETMPPQRVSTGALDRRSLVILNNTVVPPGVGVAGLQQYVEQGGGLFVIAGDRASWPSNDTTVLPGPLGETVDRIDRVGSFGYVDHSHPVFEVFKAPRSGDFTGVKVFRYRAMQAGPEARVLARYDDGGVAIAERRIGNGRVIVFTSAVDDSWNDLAIKPVYLPVVHQIARHLARYEPPSEWRSVGQVVDLTALLQDKVDRVVVTPSSEQIKVAAGATGAVELNEQGIYEVRSAGDSAPLSIAVNLDPAEADLARIDEAEMRAAVTGRAVETAPADLAGAAEQTPTESERQQNLWWYLLLAGLLVLASEMALSNRYSRNESIPRYC